MLKKSASIVLASLRGSPYRTEYDSPLRLRSRLRPRIGGPILPLDLNLNLSLYRQET
jgi:hypothetical protein